MDKLHFFDKIPAKIPADQIYARLGYEQGITQISSKQKKEVDGYIDQARGLLKLQALARRINIKSKTDSELELSDTVTFESKLVASVFKDCQELLLMAATAGWEIT